MITRTQLKHLIDELVIGRNAYRNRLILEMRLCDGMTYEMIAEEIQLSVRQVKNIVYKYGDMIYSHMDE